MYENQRKCRRKKECFLRSLLLLQAHYTYIHTYYILMYKCNRLYKKAYSESRMETKYILSALYGQIYTFLPVLPICTLLCNSYFPSFLYYHAVCCIKASFSSFPTRSLHTGTQPAMHTHERAELHTTQHADNNVLSRSLDTIFYLFVRMAKVIERKRDRKKDSAAVEQHALQYSIMESVSIFLLLLLRCWTAGKYGVVWVVSLLISITCVKLVLEDICNVSVWTWMCTYVHFMYVKRHKRYILDLIVATGTSNVCEKAELIIIL